MASLDTMTGLWSVDDAKQRRTLQRYAGDLPSKHRTRYHSSSATGTMTDDDDSLMTCDANYENYTSSDPSDTDSGDGRVPRHKQRGGLSGSLPRTTTPLPLHSKPQLYDSDDSGTVCVEESCAEEGGLSFEERFGHLFASELPPPRRRVMTRFSYMSVRNSKRRAPLPPFRFDGKKLGHPPVRQTKIQKARSATSLDTQDGRKSNHVIKRRLSLAALLPSSRFPLPKVPQHFTQTAPGNLQIPLSSSQILHRRTESSSSLQDSTTIGSSTAYSGSLRSISNSSSFPSYSSSLSGSTCGSYVMIIPHLEGNLGTDGNSHSADSYNDFTSSGTSTTSSWGTSSFSSFQTLDSKENTKFNLQDFPSLIKPLVQYQRSAKSLGSLSISDDFETTKHATIVPSSIRGSSKSTYGLDLLNKNKEYDLDYSKRLRSSSEGCHLDGVPLIRPNPLGAEDDSQNSDVSATAKIQSPANRLHKFRKSLRNKSFMSKTKLYRSKDVTSSHTTKSLRHWFSAISLRGDSASDRNGINKDLKYNNYSDLGSEDSCPETLVGESLIETKSDPELNLMLEKVNIKESDNRTRQCSPRPENTFSRLNISELRQLKVNMSGSESCIDTSTADEEWYLKHTRVVVLPFDTQLTEPPIYENVTCVIKPKHQSKLMGCKLRALPVRQRPKIKFDQFIPERKCATFSKIVEESDSLVENTSGSFSDEDGEKFTDVHVYSTDFRNSSAVNVDAISTSDRPSTEYKGNCDDSLETILNCDQENQIVECNSNSASDDTVSSLTPNSGSINKLKVSLNQKKKYSTISAVGSGNIKVQTLSSLSNKPSRSNRHETLHATRKSFSSGQSSLIMFKKPITPKLGASVKDLIQRFSSLENLSNFNHTLPSRSPKRTQFTKSKVVARNVMSNYLDYGKTEPFQMAKYQTWDKNVSKQFRNSVSCDEAFLGDTFTGVYSDSICSVVSKTDDGNTAEYKPLQTDDVELRTMDESVADGNDAVDSAQEDSPFTAMIKNSRVLKSTRRLDLSLADVITDWHEIPDTKTDVTQFQESDTVSEADNSLWSPRLPTYTSLCIPHDQEAAYEEVSPEEKTHRSLDFLMANKINSQSDNYSKFARIKYHDYNGGKTEENNDVYISNVKKSPFQKFKESLFHPFQQPFSGHRTKLDISRSFPDSQRCGRDEDLTLQRHEDLTLQRHEDNGHVYQGNEGNTTVQKTSKSKSYIQLVSRKTWKDVGKRSFKSKTCSTLQNGHTPAVGNRCRAPSRSCQSSPVFPAERLRTSADLVSNFSSNKSSRASSISSSPEPLSNTHTAETTVHHGQSSGSGNTSCDPNLNCDSICEVESQLFVPAESSSFYQDLDRSLTYASQQPCIVAQDSGARRDDYISDRARYFSLFKNPKKYFNPYLSFNLGHHTPQNEISSQRRHSLSNFSPEILNNDWKSSKKLTPSALYPITLSPTPTKFTLNSSRRFGPPPEPPRIPHSFLTTSPSLPLPPPPPPPLPSNPPPSLPYSPPLQHPPYFCTQNLASYTESRATNNGALTKVESLTLPRRKQPMRPISEFCGLAKISSINGNCCHSIASGK